MHKVLEQETFHQRSAAEGGPSQGVKTCPKARVGLAVEGDSLKAMSRRAGWS